MPVEARYVVFSVEEVEALLRRFAHARKLALPEGRLRRIEAGDEGPHFVFENDFSRKQGLSLDSSMVLAAVLLDCRHQRLPIPRPFEKRLEPMGDALALVVTLGCTAVPTTAAVGPLG